MTRTANYDLLHLVVDQNQPEEAVNEIADVFDSRLAALDHFGEDRQFTRDGLGNLSGLTYGWLAGVIRRGHAISVEGDGTVSLSASAINYIELDPDDGTVSANATGFTDGLIPLARVTTNATDMTAVNGRRTWIEAPRDPRVGLDVGGGDVTLSNAQAAHRILECTGSPGIARTVTVPTRDRQWTVANLTGDGSTVTFTTSGGSGVTIASGSRAIIYCDGTDVVRVTPDT